MNIAAINNNFTGPVQNSDSSIPYPRPKGAAEENTTQTDSKKSQTAAHSAAVNDAYKQQMTQAELRLLQELKQTDTKIRRHEMAHIAAGGRYITSGANFSYKRGPDGKNYAVSGEVGIDTSPVPGDPEATIQKMRQVRSAALAPASPSPQDIKVASKASQASAKALSDLMIIEAKKKAESNESQALGNLQQASDSYVKVNSLPEEASYSFQIAV